MAEYLGKQNGLITNESLCEKLSITTGTNVFTGDIEFLKFLKDDSLYLIPINCLKSSITRSSLNSVATGQTVILDNGYEFQCKLMSGNNDSKTDWEEFIVDNASVLEGIIDVTRYTWCYEQVISSPYAGFRTRGYEGNLSEINYLNGSKSYTYVGFRPILKLAKAKPVISIDNVDLGECPSCIDNISYSVNNSGYNFTLVEKLNGTVIRFLENQPSGMELILNLSDRWDSLPYGKFFLEIIVSDDLGLSSTVVIKFEKIKLPIEILPDTSTLDQAILYTGKLDEEIDYQCARLKNCLIEKGIDVESIDKMSNLIDEVSSIKIMNNIVCGNSWTLYTGKDLEGGFFSSSTPEELHRFSNFPNSGGCIIKVSLLGSGNTSYAYVRHIRGGVVLEEKKISNYHTQSAEAVHLVWENQNILIGDEIVILGSHGKSSSTPAKIYNVSITCDLPY